MMSAPHRLLGSALGVLTFFSASAFPEGRQIVIPAAASPTERYAAGELRDVLRKATGVELAIVTEGAGILLGTPDGCRLIGENREALGLTGDAETSAVYTRDGTLILAGTTDHAVLHAVYVFAQEVLGVRWLWPGEDGEFIPERRNWVLPELALNRTGAFLYRGFHLVFNHVDPAFETWMTRNFVNIMRSEPENRHVIPDRRKQGIHIMFSGHNVRLPSALFAGNPEYFAMGADGVRSADHGQLCLSNPEVKERIIAQIGQWLAENPEVEIVSVFPEDNEHYCQCPPCSAVSRSTNWFGFFRDVAIAMKADFPDVRFASIAYQGYLEVPALPLDGVDLIEYCQYENSLAHPYDSDDADNAESLRRIAQWRQTGVPLGIYNYDFDFFSVAGMTQLSLPIFRHIADQVRVSRRLGMHMLIPEVPILDGSARDVSRQNRLGIYLYAQLMWNPDQDLIALIEDYNRRAYGAAGGVMGEIQEIHQSAWENAPIPLTAYGHDSAAIAGRILDDASSIRILELFEQAVRLADGEELARVNQERLYFDQWLLAARRNVLPLPRTTINVPRGPSHPVSPPEAPGAWYWQDGSLYISGTGECVMYWRSIRDLYGSCRELRIHADGTWQARILPAAGEAVPEWRPDLEVRTGAGGWQARLGDDPLYPVAPNERRLVAFRPEGPWHNVYFNHAERTGQAKLTMLFPNQGTYERSDNLLLELIEYGWELSFLPAEKFQRADAADADVILFLVPGDSALAPEQIGSAARAALENGQTVLMGGYHALPLERYLEDPGCAMTGSGWNIDRYHPVAAKSPELTELFRGGIAPAWGYTPREPALWEEWATLYDHDGAPVPLLLTRRYGNGLLAVCGGDLGTGGDYTVFGNARPDTVRQLLEFLLRIAPAAPQRYE